MLGRKFSGMLYINCTYTGANADLKKLETPVTIKVIEGF